jgi:hypothetical protein
MSSPLNPNGNYMHDLLSQSVGLISVFCIYSCLIILIVNSGIFLNSINRLIVVMEKCVLYTDRIVTCYLDKLRL